MSLINYNINLNENKFSKYKKNIVLLIKKSPGEIDWIVPILFFLQKDYNIFTIFKNVQAINLLKENKTLYSLWNKCSYAYTVHPKYRNIFLRILKKIFSKLKFTHLESKIHNLIQKKFYDTNEILINIKKKLHIKNRTKLNFSGCFLEYTYKSPWIDNYKNNFKNLKIFYYPHTSQLSSSKKLYKKYYKKKPSNKFLLLNSEFDVYKWSKILPDSNIFICGYPKYDKVWIRNILKEKKKKKNQKIIFFSYKGLQKNNDKEKYFEQVRSFMNICSKIKNVYVKIKIHPFTDKNILSKILKEYPNTQWGFYDDHLFKLINNCNLFVSYYFSGSMLEGLALNKVPLELWNIENNRGFSPYKKLKLSVFINNKNELEKKIRGYFNNKKEILKEKNMVLNNYKKLINKKNSIKSTVNFIKSKLNS